MKKLPSFSEFINEKTKDDISDLINYASKYADALHELKDTIISAYKNKNFEGLSDKIKDKLVPIVKEYDPYTYKHFEKWIEGIDKESASLTSSASFWNSLSDSDWLYERGHHIGLNDEQIKELVDTFSMIVKNGDKGKKGWNYVRVHLNEKFQPDDKLKRRLMEGENFKPIKESYDEFPEDVQQFIKKHLRPSGERDTVTLDSNWREEQKLIDNIMSQTISQKPKAVINSEGATVSYYVLETFPFILIEFETEGDYSMVYKTRDEKLMRNLQ